MRAWWWRTVAACASLAVVAGAVAVVATALDADRDQRASALAADAAVRTRSAPAPSRVADAGAAPQAPRPAAGRVADPVAGASVLLPPGWRRVPAQQAVPVVPGRFPLVLAPNAGTAVLVGPLDPVRPGVPVDEARATAEARRLVAAFADGVDPGGRVVTVSDAADTVDGRPAWTSLRRVDGGPRDAAGTLVRVTTVTGAQRGVVALAVARPGPTQDADAHAADTTVRSLDLGGGPGGRPALAPRPVTAPPVAVPPVAVPPVAVPRVAAPALATPVPRPAVVPPARPVTPSRPAPTDR